MVTTVTEKRRVETVIMDQHTSAMGTEIAVTDQTSVILKKKKKVHKNVSYLFLERIDNFLGIVKFHFRNNCIFLCETLGFVLQLMTLSM